MTAAPSALSMIEAAAARHPGLPAIEGPDGHGVTYAALLTRARTIAATVEPGAVVELTAERSADFVARCLGAWLAGAAWAPLDPADPPARRAAIRARLGAASATAAPDAGAPAAPAYLIPTSGSSGAPKLVVVSHRGLPALLGAQIAAFELGPGARALWLHAPIFDASLSDWGTALAAGATLVIPSPAALAAPAALRAELADRRVTHVDLPPALLPHLPPEQPPSSLRVVVLGGEACPIAPLGALARRLRVVVVYGPTEATVCSSLAVLDPATLERWDRPRIGLPLPEVRYRVVSGELWIGGPCLALGYAGDPDETARRFVEDAGARWYRTGDLVEDDGGPGGLAFLGRADRQAKLAGRRVELTEIEAALQRAPGVLAAAAAVRPIEPGGRPRLVAFVEPVPAAAPALAAALRAQLRAAVPAWMIPSRVVVGPLPRTATGKIDHAALVRCELSRRSVPAPPPGPPDPLAADLADLWCDALGRDVVTAESFFDAGGDSLAALALHAGAAARGLALDPRALDGDPTFDELLGRARAAASPALTVAECERRGLIAAAAAAAASGLARRAGAARGAVLLTGVTGALGPALLRAWRARDDRPLFALVRAPDNAAARRRLAETLGELPGVTALAGDLARPLLGLSLADHRALSDRLSAIVHAAAHLQLWAGWDAHAPTNVAGTAAISQLAAVGGAALHHISTLSVFVNTDRPTGRHAESATPPLGAIAHGGYAQTKIAAESIVRRASGHRALTTLFRLGLLVGDPPRVTDQLAMTLRGLARLGAIPAGAADLLVDLTPISYAAAAIAALALRAEALPSGPAPTIATHHIAAAHAASFGDLAAGLRAAGAELRELSPADWAALARPRLSDPDIAMAYLSLGRGHTPGPRLQPYDLFLATGADFDTAATARLLAALGVPPPPPARDLIPRLLTGALRAEPAP